MSHWSEERGGGLLAGNLSILATDLKGAPPFLILCSKLAVCEMENVENSCSGCSFWECEALSL